MFMSQEIDIKLCQNYTKSYSYEILYKIRSIKQTIFNNYWSRDTRDNDTALLLGEVLVT